MDVFRILTRGANIARGKGSLMNDKNGPDGFPKTVNKEEKIKNEVEKETDFFRTKRHLNTVKHDNDKEQDKDSPDRDEQEEEEEESNILDMIRSEEEAKSFRKKNKVKVTGSDIPLPVATFNDLTTRFRFDKKVLSNLIESGFTEPTPVQCESMPIALSRRDAIACAPTGSGKTLAFLVPLIQNIIVRRSENTSPAIKGLIIAPTKELATQIHDELQALVKGKKLKVGVLSKLLASKINNKAVNASKYDILISTPLRLIECVKKETVDLSRVEELIVDEADRLFEEGFVEQTDDILFQCTYPKIRKSIFSATIPSGVEEMAQSIMRDPVRVIVGHKEAASELIQQKLVFTGNEQGKLLAIRQMITENEFVPPVIIFLQSITRAKALFHELIYDKLNVDVIHAERTQKQRDDVIKRFKNGDIWVLITTDVISRGVDFKGVNLVINYDVPQSAQSYVHRIGRTARGGRSGKAVTFFTKEDTDLIKPVINVMKQSGCHDGYSEWMEDVSKLNKKTKKSIKAHQVSREQISTVPKAFKKEKKRRAQMIESSRKRHQVTESS